MATNVLPVPDSDNLFDTPLLAQVVAGHSTDPAARPPAPAPSSVSSLHLHPWMASLQVHDKGHLLGSYKSNHNNAIIALTHSPEWHGVFGYNELDANIWIRRRNGQQFIEPNTELTELHFGTLYQWFDKLNMDMTDGKLRTAIYAVANLPENKFHPVRDYLSALPPWDGVPVLSHWLEYMFGATEDVDYLSAIGQCWMRCAVARIFEPGCKVDNMLIIEGQQGTGKSKALAILAGEWFTDQLPKDLGNAAASHALQGKWIIELSELSSFKRSEIEDVKAFVSRQTDYYRKPYARKLENIPRQCVLAGTTNVSDWLKDETGGRRFWPFTATKINFDLLRKHRDQLWAEALYQYRAKLPLYLDFDLTKLAKVEQAKRLEDDEWVDLLETYLQFKDQVTTRELTTEVLAIPVGSVSLTQNKRLAGVMLRLGFERTQIWASNTNMRGFKRICRV